MIRLSFDHGLVGASERDLLATKQEAEQLIKSIDEELRIRPKMTAPRPGFSYNGYYYVYDTYTEAVNEAVHLLKDPEAGYRVFPIYR